MNRDIMVLGGEVLDGEGAYIGVWPCFLSSFKFSTFPFSHSLIFNLSVSLAFLSYISLSLVVNTFSVASRLAEPASTHNTSTINPIPAPSTPLVIACTNHDPPRPAATPCPRT